MEKKIVGWYLLEEHRPKNVPDEEWNSDRIITIERAEAEGGLMADFETKVVPVFIEV